ncbi:aminotransferase class I and II domain-containing protein [Hirsutella rhossiliensis]|uniref:Aminotransferase class I and II domain-containing protein n=1 Tax=Hirsutella rhossiliensis TaxID=111463 RepID=A0A9P8MYL2_9HYPO|nr:aminotransferase class I and II domain-containing protein [Hirsutella rhossiliensis]KAH0962744.1 aminotransferase class I and II domain-containing protein [Hirsutella rhossiliensis]
MSLSRLAEKLSLPGSDPNALFLKVVSDIWDAGSNPDGFINLGAAENSLMHAELLEHIHSNIKIPPMALTYGDGHKRVKHAVARFLTRHLKPLTPIEPGHVLVSNGCTPAIESISWACANSGDAILIGRPYYGTFPADVGKRTGVELIPLSFGGVDPMGADAVRAHDEAICAAKKRGQRVAAIILAHPHNPLGRCYGRDALVAYMELCQRHQIHLVSDEIYALSVFENRADTEAPPVPFQSVLSIDPTGIIDPGLVHVLWGMSKDFGANGLRMGFTITQHNQRLRTALQAVFEFSWTSSLSDLVTANMLEDDEWVKGYIQENQRRLSLHHQKVITWAREHGIEYAPGSNAGFFVWANLGAVYRKHCAGPVADLDKAVMDSLIAHKVFLADGVHFGAEQPGWFRIIFSREEDYIEEGLRRIAAAIGEGQSAAAEPPQAVNGGEGGRLHNTAPVLRHEPATNLSTIGICL